MSNLTATLLVPDERIEMDAVLLKTGRNEALYVEWDPNLRNVIRVMDRDELLDLLIYEQAMPPESAYDAVIRIDSTGSDHHTYEWDLPCLRVSDTAVVLRRDLPSLARMVRRGSSRAVCEMQHQLPLEINLVASQKMDAPGLVQAVCSCGEYEVRGGPFDAMRAGRDHAASKHPVVAT